MLRPEPGGRVGYERLPDSKSRGLDVPPSLLARTDEVLYELNS